MDQNEYDKKLKSELKEIASLLLKDEIYFVEGIRSIADKLDIIILDDEDINLFRGIDSDTGDVPVGDTRKLWNQEALKKIDDELVHYIERVKPQVKNACKKIIKTIEES